MKSRRKSVFRILILAIIIAGAGIYLLCFSNASRERKLENRILSLTDGSEVSLEEVVPFDWDAAYSFDPYTDRETIEEIIGFSSRKIRETTGEGMMHLLFVKDQRVVAQICGYGSEYGFSVYMDSCIRDGDQTRFSVSTEGKSDESESGDGKKSIICLSQID